MQTAALLEPAAVIIVSPDPLVRRAVRAALAQRVDLAVVAEDVGGAGARDATADALVWDGGLDGDDLPVDLQAPAVMLLSDAGAADRAWRRGAAGVLARGADADKLAAAIHAVASGLRVFDPSLGGPQPASDDETLVEPLTPRELEVLALVADGLSNRRIAKRLGISEHTVKFHVNALLEKLDADTRTAAVVRAARHGLLHL